MNNTPNKGANRSGVVNPSEMISSEHLRCVFNPKGVAVVGATERPGSVGRTVMENLIQGYKDLGPNPFELYGVNPSRESVLDVKCYPKVSAIPGGKCEQVVIITPAAKCLDVVKDCAQNPSVRVLVIIAAGFKEIGEEGAKLERDLVQLAAEANMAVIGPNCLGVMCPNWQLNATFAADSAKKGHVAFISQSGAMCTAVLDWALKVGLGFSAFVSIGSMSHIEFADCIDFLGQDPNTNAIILYMETIGNAHKFMMAARRISQKKPIVVIKAGKTAAAAAAAVSHTGSLAGSHDAFLAAMARAGCSVVETIDDLQNVAMLSAMQPRPTNNDIIIVTNAGGPGVLATDAAATAGLNIVELEQSLVDQLNGFLPPAWSHHNPIDVLGDAKAETYAKAVEAIFEKGSKGASMLVVLSPQSVTEPENTAQAVVDAVRAKRAQKGDTFGPVVCAWMGGNQVESGRKILMDGGVPCFAMPDVAAQALAHLSKSVDLARELSAAPQLSSDTSSRSKANSVLDVAAKEGRSILTESESKTIMKAYGITVAESIICNSAEEAGKAGDQVGYPCVVKLNSETITHKSDVGGVKLNIKSAEAVREAFHQIKTAVDKIGPQHFKGVSVQPMLDISAGVEVFVGSSADSQFGPMCVFGAGGCFVEVFKDVATSVPPLDRAGAEKLVKATKISKALIADGSHGERFKGCPVDKLCDIIEKFSHLICDLADRVPECEINPLLALPDRVIALDARVVLRTNDQTNSTAPLAPPCLL